MVQNGQDVSMSDTSEKTCPTLTEEGFEALLNRLKNENESEHESVKSSLVNYFATDLINSTEVLMKYRLKQPTLPKNTVVVLLNAVQTVLSNQTEIPRDALEEFLIFGLEELTASNQDDPLIQNPASDTLVTLASTHDCKMVMEALIAHAKKGAQNALIYECFTKLSEANCKGVLAFIKSILPTLHPRLAEIKIDRLRKSKISAICSFCKAILKHSSDIASSEQNAAEKSRTEIEEMPNCKMEIYDSYNSLFSQWVRSHNSELSIDILHALGAVGSLFDMAEKLPNPPDNMKNPKATLPPKQVLSTIRKRDMREITPKLRGNSRQSKSPRRSYVAERAKDAHSSRTGPKLCGAAKKRLAYFIAKGYSREAAKLKALRPMIDRRTPTRHKSNR